MKPLGENQSLFTKDDDFLICSKCKERYSVKAGARVGRMCTVEDCEDGILMIPSGKGTQNKESTG